MYILKIANKHLCSQTRSWFSVNRTLLFTPMYSLFILCLIPSWQTKPLALNDWEKILCLGTSLIDLSMIYLHKGPRALLEKNSSTGSFFIHSNLPYNCPRACLFLAGEWKVWRWEGLSISISNFLAVCRYLETLFQIPILFNLEPHLHMKRDNQELADIWGKPPAREKLKSTQSTQKRAKPHTKWNRVVRRKKTGNSKII